MLNLSSPPDMLSYITLCCRHCLLYKNRKTMNIRNTNTRLFYTKHNFCHFRINILLCKITNRWMLSKSSTDRKCYSIEHSDHIWLDPWNLQDSVSFIPANELKLMSQYIQSKINCSQIANITTLQSIFGTNAL